MAQAKARIDPEQLQQVEKLPVHCIRVLGSKVRVQAMKPVLGGLVRVQAMKPGCFCIGL